MNQGIVKSFYYSKWFILVIFIIIVFFSVSAVRDYYSQEDLRDDISTLENQMGDLQEEQYSLSETLIQVQSEDFIETEARTKLNLRKPGENVVIVSSSEDIQKFNEQSEGMGIKGLLEEPESNLQRWWYFFFPSF